MKLVRFHPKTDLEFANQIKWYNGQVESLGIEFFHEVWEAIDIHIQKAPKTWPVYF